MRAPERGNLIWLSFTPQSGCERAGRRPALVLAPSTYNSKVGLALVCPMTSKVKGYPFEVAMPEKGTVQGVILADEPRSLDWCSREAELIAKATIPVVESVLKLLGALLSSP